jgi:opacity protein-like surface antigen
MADRILAVAIALMLAQSAAAQTPEPTFAAGAVFVTTQSGQFHTNDVGVGGWVGWRVLPLIGLEGELTYHADPFGEARAFSAGRIEGLFGATIGPRLDWLRPFVTVRPGFVTYRAPEEPIACIAIFPPPLSCRLAEGRTLFALDVGGGLEFSPTDRSLIRLTLSDRMVRYPSPAFDTSGERHDDSFSGHDLRFAVGAGVRF